MDQYTTNSFWNNNQFTGKFHFRLYLLCCSETYACIRLRIHTRNQSDLADGQNMNPTEPKKKPREVVVEQKQQA
jgi:hypothetical protein